MRYLILIVSSLLLAACSDVGSFTVEQSTGEVLVEGNNSPVNDLLPDNVLPAIPLEFDLQSELEKRDADAAKGVYLNALTLQVTDTAIEDADDIDNFDFLDNISFYVESSDADSELERVLIGSVDPVPEDQTTLDVDVDDSVNLKPYAQEGMRITTSGSGSVPSDDVTIEGNVVVEVQIL